MEKEKTSIELAAEWYLALYEQMMAPWRFEKWVKDLEAALVTFPLVEVEAVSEAA